MKNKLTFFKESIKSFKTTGTVMPSSRFLINRMLKELDFSKMDTIVEYGPGNGNITKEILNRMHKSSKLFCFEINTEFYNHLKTINDDRLILINNSAEEVKEILQNHTISHVDCFISSLPLTIIPKDIANNILSFSKDLLIQNGKFIQYQYSLNFLKVFKQIFGSNNVFLDFELMNIPPAFIYKCKNPIKQ